MNKKSKNIENIFIICTYTDIVCFTYIEDHFITNETNIYVNNINSKIKCGTALRINSKNPNLVAHAEEDEQTILIITGHKNGQILVWKNFVLERELANYNCEILNIDNNESGIFIATDAATLNWVCLYLFNFL